MLKPLICGSNFHNQESDSEEEQWSNSPISTPRKSSSSRKSSSKNSKNPFSARGLDKFSQLVADLEKKRKEIHSKVGPEDVYVVRFTYSNSNTIVPVVIKLKDRKQDKTKDIKANKPINQDTEVFDEFPIEAQQVPEKAVKQYSRPVEADSKTAKNTRTSIWNLNKLHTFRRPAYYMPVFIILILLLLVFFGRSFTILCMSLGWYILPTLSSNSPIKKKEYGRGFSEIKMMNNNGLSSPKSKNNGAVKSKSFQYLKKSPSG